MTQSDGADGLRDKSELERQFEAELPSILIESERDHDRAVSSVDRYLGGATDAEFRKTLFSWKGRLYLEHGRHPDAVRELRTADGIRSADDLQNLNTKIDLSLALQHSGDADAAYDVLAAGLDEIGSPPAVLKLLQALVRLPQLAPPLLQHAETALQRVKDYYGIELGREPDNLEEETTALAEIVHDAAARYHRLDADLRRLPEPDEVVAALEAYIQQESVPYFQQQAHKALEQVRAGMDDYRNLMFSLSAAVGQQALEELARESAARMKSTHLRRMVARHIATKRNDSESRAPKA